jgi:hypothetical protein
MQPSHYLSAARGSQDFENRIYHDLRLVHLDVVTGIINRKSLPMSGHCRNLIVQVYPEFVLRIALLLSFGGTTWRRLMRQDDKPGRSLIRRTLGC